MGNCLVIHGRKEIKVVSFVDGEILKALPAPAAPSSNNKVVVVSSSDADYALPKPHDMAQLYRLFHAAPPPPPATATAAASADHPAAAGDVVRVKLVISKQELRRMLGKDGQQGVSVEDMVALIRRRSSSSSTTTEEMSCCRSSAGWRPALQSIPEGCSDFFY